MIKKLFALILCGIIVFSFVACRHEKPTSSVFDTENIARITFYAYYGESEVPAEHMEEIINWLKTFTFDKEFDEDDIPPGTNAYCVKIEYLDGTVIDEGLDMIEVDGTLYSIKHAEEPACFMEIMSNASHE